MSVETQTYKVEYESSPELLYPSDNATIISSLTPNQINYITQDASTGNSTSSISFKVSLPETTSLGKDIRIKTFFKCKFTHAGITAGILSPAVVNLLIDDIAFAELGLMNLINTMTFSHGSSEKFNISKPQLISQILMTTVDPALVDQTLSDCQMKMDVLPDYNKYDSAATAECLGVADEPKHVYVKRSAMTDSNIFAFHNGNQLYSSRVPNVSVENIAVGSCDILFSLSTFIPCSLFDRSITNSSYNVFGINNFSLDLHLSNNFERLFAVADPAKYKFSQFSFTKAPQIRLQSYTPKDYILADARDEMGKFKNYLIPFTSYETNYEQQVGSSVVMPDKETSVIVNNCNFSTLPKKIYVAVLQDREGNLAHSIPCSFGRIESCTVSINGSQSLVNSDSEHLLNLSQRNGLQLDRTSAMYFTGFPIVIDTTKDVSASSLVGENQGINLSLNLKFRSLSTSTDGRMYKIVIVGEYDNILKYENNNVKYMYTALATALKPDSNEIMSKTRKYTSGIYAGGRSGAGFFDTIGKIGRFTTDKIIPTIGSVASIVKTLKGGKSEITGGKAVKDSKFY